MLFIIFQVRKVVQQEGFDRKKRGYRDINDIDINMNDPLFTKQWYLVSERFSMFEMLMIQDSFMLITVRLECQ